MTPIDEALRRTQALEKGQVDALVDLGDALLERGQPAEAAAALEKAVLLAPGSSLALGNLGNAYLALGRPAESIAVYERALALRPGNARVRCNTALARLLAGDFERGWEDYEARLALRHVRDRHRFAQPRWDGRNGPLEGRSLLVYDEQGCGDALQFARYVPLLVERGARVSLRVRSNLARLLACLSGVAAIYSRKESLPPFDLYCPMPSLPRAFGTRLGTIPARVPYLSAPWDKVAEWRRVFAGAPGRKVGLVWSGNPVHPADARRSLPLRQFARIAEGMPAHFFSLQKAVRAGDAPVLNGMPGIADLSGRLADFQSTAALVAALDLVVTVDTATAHLAGALGVKTWILLPFAPDWRWLLGREDSPWYPTVRLFRQPGPGEWEPAIDAVREQLAAWLQAG